MLSSKKNKGHFSFHSIFNLTSLLLLLVVLASCSTGPEVKGVLKGNLRVEVLSEPNLPFRLIIYSYSKGGSDGITVELDQNFETSAAGQFSINMNGGDFIGYAAHVSTTIGNTPSTMTAKLYSDGELIKEASTSGENILILEKGDTSGD